MSVQKRLGDFMERYLLTMNLPSRAQMMAMAERLDAIEGQLNDIKALLHQMSASAAPPQPPRNKRPPSPTKEQK